MLLQSGFSKKHFKKCRYYELTLNELHHYKMRKFLNYKCHEERPFVVWSLVYLISLLLAVECGNCLGFNCALPWKSNVSCGISAFYIVKTLYGFSLLEGVHGMMIHSTFICCSSKCRTVIFRSNRVFAVIIFMTCSAEYERVSTLSTLIIKSPGKIWPSRLLPFLTV